MLRRGPALAVLQGLVAETGAGGVWWSRLYDPASITRDRGVKAALRQAGCEAQSFPGHLLHEPWEVVTGGGGCYRVFTPYWRAMRQQPVPAPLPDVRQARGPAVWPASDALPDWRLDAGMNRGAPIVAAYQAVGEGAARGRLQRFLAGPVAGYAGGRDFPAGGATSHLSENLTYGEIGIREVWHAVLGRDGTAGAEAFLRELAWREFSYHLLYHFPDMAQRNWKPDWDHFPWRGDTPDAERWRRGLTGEPFVDAAMRELYVTGKMHNRARMVAASYLTKHLMTGWRVGLQWFADCLTDWDPAANAMGWQWVAGSGPDAAPYFRIFNPVTQAEKFDPDGAYRDRFLAERSQGAEALLFFQAVPRSWRLGPGQPYPQPVISHAEGRQRALAAYAARKSDAEGP